MWLTIWLSATARGSLCGKSDCTIQLYYLEFLTACKNKNGRSRDISNKPMCNHLFVVAGTMWMPFNFSPLHSILGYVDPIVCTVLGHLWLETS